MNWPPEFPPYAAINARLAEVVKHAPSPPAWYAPWSRLDRESSDEERLKVYQAVRDSNLLPEEAGFYLVSWQIDAITSERASTELRQMETRLDELEEERSIDEHRRLLDQYHAAWDDLFVQTLEEHGEREIAAVFQNDRDLYEQIHESGRVYFHGPLLPAWLEEFTVTVGECLQADEPMGPGSYRWREEDGFWEIDLYPTPVELVGGAVDGTIVSPGFSVDLIELQSLFEQIEAVT